MPKNILTAEQVLEVFNDERSLVFIAREYGVSSAQIHNIKSGRRWSAVTGIYHPNEPKRRRRKLDCYHVQGS